MSRDMHSAPRVLVALRSLALVQAIRWGGRTLTRKQEAIAMRDVALPVIRAKGSMREASGVRVLTSDHDGISMILTTPFQRMPGPRPPRSYGEALAHESYKPPLPYMIDVWAKGKVLSVSWDDSGDVEVTNFKPGPWQDDLRRQADAIKTSERSAKAGVA